MDQNTSDAKWVSLTTHHRRTDGSSHSSTQIGYQILGGSGMGALYMLGFIASQVVLPEVDRARGSAVVVFAQLFGATWVASIPLVCAPS